MFGGGEGFSGQFYGAVKVGRTPWKMPGHRGLARLNVQQQSILFHWLG